jgi:hypothetical protein
LRALLALALLSFAAGACARAPLPKDVQAVIDRSHASRASYAVAITAEVVTSGRRHIDRDWEFHQGAMHRVEVPIRRVVANCDTDEGSVYDAVGGRYVDGSNIVPGACGIAVGADTVVSARMLAPITGAYGRADVVELTGEKFVRRYGVTADGIIVLNDYTPRTADVGFSDKTLNVVVRRGPQDPAMFTRESLTRAFAPATAQDR